jgi:hypothetical protein
MSCAIRHGTVEKLGVPCWFLLQLFAKQKEPVPGCQFTSEVIVWAVRWYLQFPISYRDLELMLRDWGVSVDHTTLYRWIQAYAVELEKRLRPHLRPTSGSWWVDETSLKVKDGSVLCGWPPACKSFFEPRWNACGPV